MTTETQLDTRDVAIIFVRSGGKSIWQKGYTKPDGTWQDRNYEGISETIEPGESHTMAAVRGLHEELGLIVGGNELQRLTYSDSLPRTRTATSPSTGRETLYRYWYYELELSPTKAANIPLQVNEGKGTLHLEWRDIPA